MTYADKIQMDLVRLAIEKALLDVGPNEFENICLLLTSKYGYTIDDCLYHPDVLKEILCQTYGSQYDDVIKSISETLSVSSADSIIDGFIEALR